MGSVLEFHENKCWCCLISFTKIDEIIFLSRKVIFWARWQLIAEPYTENKDTLRALVSLQDYCDSEFDKSNGKGMDGWKDIL